MGYISYTAVVLKDSSRQRLINYFKAIIPEGWEIAAHHMTINMGKIDPEFEQDLGTPVQLSVNDIALNDKVIAVGVSGFGSRNDKPHITLAVNKKAGAKAMMSNSLTDWKNLKRPLLLAGKVTEVEFQ